MSLYDAAQVARATAIRLAKLLTRRSTAPMPQPVPFSLPGFQANGLPEPAMPEADLPATSQAAPQQTPAVAAARAAQAHGLPKLAPADEPGIKLATLFAAARLGEGPQLSAREAARFSRDAFVQRLGVLR